MKYSCLMMECPASNWSYVLQLIDVEDVHPGEGLESWPHVTVLYGIYPEIPFGAVIDKLKLSLITPATAKLTGISHFENDEYDVVKFDVDSEDLRRVNGVITELPSVDKYGKYEPHITIAYVKKGTGHKYDMVFEEPIEVTMQKLKYSYPDGREINFSIYDYADFPEAKTFVNNYKALNGEVAREKIKEA